MEITIVGLGLIGGSFAKAISAFTDNICFGIDLNENVIENAIKCNAIKAECKDLSLQDLIIISLYPKETVDFINQNARNFKKDSIIIDTCGIKKYICDNVRKSMEENNVTFIGCHPMAGREFSGFDFSYAQLFNGASFIMTPYENTDSKKINLIKDLAKKIKFAKVVVTTPQEHDRIITYTSQLAHIVSSSYIKSPTALKQSGFSAGSFKDLTRVAYLNEDMWTSLFLLNRENLIDEISEIIKNLSDYRDSLQNNDYNTLHELLKQGRIIKEKC